MKRAATFGLTMGVVASTLLSALPVQAADTITSVIKGVGSIVSGTVDAAGNIIDASGKVVGRVVEGSAGTVVDTAGTVVGTTGKLADTTVSEGRTITFGTVTEVLGSSLSRRRADIERLIADAIVSGKLTAAQAAELRLDLERLARAEADARTSAGSMTFDEAMVIARDLDTLSNRVATTIAVTPLLPLVITDASGTKRISVSTSVTTPGGGVIQKTTTTTTTTTTPAGAVTTIAPVTTTTPGTLLITSTPSNTPTVWWSVLDSRRSEMERAIAHALFQGTISAAQAAELRSDLYKITRTLWTAQGNVSAFTADQALVIANDLDTLANRVVTATKITALPRLVADVSGTRRLMLDNFGNIVEVSAVAPTVYVSTLDTRRAQLEAGIAAALSAGKLTEAQATEFRNWLTRINEQQRVVVTAGGVTYVKALPIATELDLLSNRLSTFMSAPLPPLVVGSRFMLTGNQVVVVDDVNVRRADIEARINREVLVGRLTIKQGDDLRDQLSAVATSEAGMRADGSLTADELMSLLSALDRVDESLNRNIASSRGRTQSVLIVPSSF